MPVTAIQGADQHMRSRLGFSIMPKDTSKCRPGQSNQWPSDNKLLPLPLNHSRPEPELFFFCLNLIHEKVTEHRLQNNCLYNNMSHEGRRTVTQRILIVMLSSRILDKPLLSWRGRRVSQWMQLLLWCFSDYNIKERLCRLSPDRGETITQQSNWIKVLSLKDGQTNSSQWSQNKEKTPNNKGEGKAKQAGLE